MSISESSFDTIIIGAGAAGLMAARELVRAGKKIIVLEAADRVGGRIATLYDTSAGIPVELGAEFIHGDAPETTRLVDEARLATVPVLGRQYRSERGELRNQGRIWNRMRLVFKHLDGRRKHDRSFQEFLDEKPGGARLKDERELARGFVQGFEAADTKLISEKSLADQGDPAEGAATARRIVNGYDALVAYLQRDSAAHIRLNVTARTVSWNESGVRVRTQDGEELEATTVIIAVPLPMLQNRTIELLPGIPSLEKASGQLVMGHVLRVNVVVKERFWEKKADDISYVHTPTRPFNVWWTQNPLRAPLLVGWSGGPPAMEISASGDIEGSAMRELSSAFAISRSRTESLVESIHFLDWNRNPLSLGAYSYAGVGGANAAAMLARSHAGTVFMAGEATDSESGGTVEAAIASGKRAAAKILKRLSR